MELKDFYFEDKAQTGARMPILLPDGTDSGEWLNIVGPEADAAVKAGRAFLFAYRAKVAELEPLQKKCKKQEDFTEYNVLLNDACTELNRQLAAEIVNGWSFDEPFSKEALENLLKQYRTLGNQVADFNAKQRKQLQEK